MDKSLANLKKGLMLSLWVIHQRLHIDKIHKNKIIPIITEYM